jgi:hypothetical protein
MEISITEVSFHQVQTAYLKIIFTPVLAATSYLVGEWLTVYKISNLLFYYKSNQRMHTIFEITIKLPHTKCYMFQSIMAHHQGAHNCTKDLSCSACSRAASSSRLTLYYVATDGATS